MTKKISAAAITRTDQALILPLTCDHTGSDCLGRIETEHLSYDPPKTIHLCSFHNQVVMNVRRNLSLTECLGRKQFGRLPNSTREYCLQAMKRHRFAPEFNDIMKQINEARAKELGLSQDRNWYEKHKVREAAKPGRMVRLRLISEGNPVRKIRWEVTSV